MTPARVLTEVVVAILIISSNLGLGDKKYLLEIFEAGRLCIQDSLGRQKPSVCVR